MIKIFQRGIHEINDEITYDNSPGFVFHDSRGLECGSTAELPLILEFIKKRVESKDFESHLHAVWYAESGGLNLPKTEYLLPGFVYLWIRWKDPPTKPRWR